ncbi:toll/interleukin-1 receptor domain-containing protein [Kallipyga massiliensis]|uniref:toll/interleukin-1 receptor domain-containing protein n=1 Tax=Kallipyga massiliensis TaxID=1472764 RepID=UPI0026F2582B|nr:toll/interleukin-1 receptor domain-containing protein [Kallipyga massiliensis]
MSITKPPKVFISYSWEEKTKEWVKSLADRLIGDGIDVDIDQYDLMLGDRLPDFMEQKIINADYVLIICTPSYKEKADTRRRGVGYEGHIISGELLEKHNETKFIPVLKEGNPAVSYPVFLKGKYGIDLTDQEFNEQNYKDLLTTLYGVYKKPALGKQPKFIHKNNFVEDDGKDGEFHPIKILGVIVDEVSKPRMDGTRGSALYRVPFRLSEKPNRYWAQQFVQHWNYPPQFTTMHRPGIASVIEDKIILDGTTIDEVKNFHRDTLKLCVNATNVEAEHEFQRAKCVKLTKEKRLKEHEEHVQKISEEIDFD